MLAVLKYEPMQKGSLIGKASIRVEKWGGFIINDIAVFEKDSKRWISFPQRPVDVDGEKKWLPVVLFDSPEVSRKFSDQVIESLDKYFS